MVYDGGILTPLGLSERVGQTQKYI